MAPQGGRARNSPSHQTHVAKPATIEVVDFYQEFVVPEDKVTMSILKEEVRMVWAYKGDEEVEEKMGGIIPYLGCTRTGNLKNCRTLELYWHTKTMVALGMLPND